MGLQFADINADGSLDIVTATFDGSPHVSLGSPLGFREPHRLRDTEGRRVLVASIWDYEKKAHLNLGRAMPDQKAVDDRCISALAFDWDGDGDHDLLLGTYDQGRLFLQMNEGTDASPRYTGKNIAVMAGGAPLRIPHKMTAPRLVDWDGDGDLDLITGSFGDVYGGSVGGAVYLVKNESQGAVPKFAAPTVLFQAPGFNADQAKAPTHPHVGLYPEVVDWDGDGDLDLIVGGYSIHTPPARALDEAEKARLAELDRESKALTEQLIAHQQKQGAMIKASTDGLDRKQDAQAWKRAQAKAMTAWRKGMTELSQKMRPIDREIDQLRPNKKRQAGVWYFERK